MSVFVLTMKSIAKNTGRLWRRPALGQSEIVCTVAIFDVHGDTAISLCRERSLARRRALAFRRGALGRAVKEEERKKQLGQIQTQYAEDLYSK